MSRLLRIAAREYLSYVRTVGFWLSLVVTPLALTASFAIPSMMDHTAPPTRLAVIDLTHEGIGQVLIQRLGDPSRGAHRPQIVPPPAEAAAAPNAAAAGAVLRRLMSGAAEQDRNARAFDAAAVLSGKGAEVSLDLWSINLADGQFEKLVRGDLADSLRRQSLIDAGVSPSLIDSADAAEPQVALYSPKTEAKGQVSLRDELPSLLGFGMGILLWAVILTGAGLLLNSVIEEKSSRILEVLLTSASVPEVMGGKILGVMGVAGTVLTFWLSLGAVAARIAAPGLLGQIAAVAVGKGLIVYFGLYLIVGYVMYASIFAAIGAFCETTRDAQTLLGPMMLILSVPLIFMAQAITHPDAPVLEALSWIPPFTPFLMVARAANDPPFWQIAGTLALMLATTIVVVWISGRAFRAGALTVGKVDRRAVLAAFMGRAG
jgi:ABC-2 type transport system permease protein